MSSFDERTTPILLPFFAVGFPNIRTFVFSTSNESSNPVYEGLVNSSFDSITLLAEGFISVIFGIGKFKNALRCNSNSFKF